MASLDELLLEKIRAGSRDLWRGVRTRLGIRVILLALLATAGFAGVLWISGGIIWDPRHWNAAIKLVPILLAMVVLFGGIALAWTDSTRTLVVAGPLLRSLGDVLLDFPLSSGGWRPEDQFTLFSSPGRLAGGLRIRDLPLLLYLSRVVLRLDIKPLLRVARTGLGREELVREMERLGRQRAATILGRLQTLIWLCLGAALLLFFLIVWLSR